MYHKAIKLIIVTEKFICEDVCKIIESCGGTGYTLVPAGGKGLHHHLHAIDSKAMLVDEFANIKIEVVCGDRAKAERMSKELMEKCFQDYPGIMYLESVEVQRLEHF